MRKKKAYTVRRGNYLCASCRYEWDPKRMPLRLSWRAWRSVIELFLDGYSIEGIVFNTGFHRKRVLRALRIIRTVLMEVNQKQYEKTLLKLLNCHAVDTNTCKISLHILPHKKTRAGSRDAYYLICRLCNYTYAEPLPPTQISGLYESLSSSKTLELLQEYCDHDCIRVYRYLYSLCQLSSVTYISSLANNEALCDFSSILLGYLKWRGGVRDKYKDLFTSEVVWRYNNNHFSQLAQTKMIAELLNHYAVYGETTGRNRTMKH